MNDTIVAVGKKGFYCIDTKKLNYSQIHFSRNHEDKDWILSTESITRTENSIWLGTQYGTGYIKNVNTPFTAFYSSMDESNIKIQHSNMLYPLNDSSIIVCADNGLHFVNCNDGIIKTIFNDGVFYSAFIGPNGYVIASNLDNGIHISDKNGVPILLEKIFPEISILKNDVLISAVKFNDSLYFLASQNEKGIYVWNPVAKTINIINTGTKPVSLASNVINRLYIDSKKDLWIVGDNYLSEYTPYLHSIKTYKLINPLNKKELSIIMDICELDNRYWLAVYGVGIVELTKDLQIKKIYSTPEGLNNTGVYKIFSLNDTSIIVSSNNALSVLNIKKQRIKNYFEDDGLQSNSFEETSGCKNKSYIFLGGTNGFTKITPNKFNINTKAPEFYFLNAKINETKNAVSVVKDTANINLAKLVIDKNWAQVNISFVGLNFLNAQRVDYKYRIKEQDTNWIFNGNQNFISLIGLNPGTYTLEVKAGNEDGYWSEPKQLTLVFEPKWYQTLWFKLLILVITAGLFYAFYRYRISQVKKQHLIRKNIASDLHDDIGSTLNTVKVFTHLAKKDIQQSEYLDEIENALTEATMGLRDMIWVLDDSQDTVNELIIRIKKFALPVTTANGLHFQCKVETDDSGERLSKTEKRNLLLMSKEVINNSIKYSECKNIDVLLKARKDMKTLIIKDDGKGFSNDGASDGNGLKNLSHRAEQIGYKVEIISSDGNGTTIKIEKK